MHGLRHIYTLTTYSLLMHNDFHVSRKLEQNNQQMCSTITRNYFGTVLAITGCAGPYRRLACLRKALTIVFTMSSKNAVATWVCSAERNSKATCTQPASYYI